MARTHGKRSTYKAGCRCDECRAANTAAVLRQRAARVERAAAGLMPPGIRHGLNTARSWGCRCDVCRTAFSAAVKEYNERAGYTRRAKELNDRTRAEAHRHRYVWTGPELELITREGLTAEKCAETIGRTVAAVEGMRARIASGEPKILRLLGKVP